MKTEIILGASSILAAADLVQRRFIGFDGTLCAANARARGVSAADTKAGQMCPINISGEVLVESGGAMAAGAPLASDALGKAVAATALSVSVPAGATAVTSTAAQPDLVEAGGYLPQAVNGYAIDAAAGAGEFIRVRLV
ncbi:MAG: DUF2190 family protein [Nitrospirae bacterium]|nr:DUF2190 family protein [Nitrospirota bacterium]MCL5237413.1 DUF2190 family protein [Nitrospirota bacterium]